MKADFKYISNIDKNSDFGEMFIYDEIGDDKVNGRHFAYELKYLLEYENFSEIKVRINSVGGNVMHAFSIFSAIVNANKDYKGVEVNTYNDGVAASSASFVLMSGKNIYSKDYARLMIHGVSQTDDEGNVIGDGLTEKDKTALTNFKEMITTVFVGNTGIVAEYIDDLLTNGKDNWFTAQEAAKAGFFPEENIEGTSVELDLPEDLSLVATAVANKAQKILNNNNEKTLKMKKVIALLNLQDGASEEVVAKAVQNALKDAKTSKDALATAETTIETQKGKIDTLQAKVGESQKAAALAVVENAIKEGKFSPKDEDAKGKLVEQAEANLDGFKNMISMMPTKAANIIDATTTTTEAATGLLAKVNNRGFRTLEKEDGALLAQIKNELLPEYVKLYNAEYKTDKTEEDFK